ncbi:MAG: lysozyme [Amphiplicatus sp.]
MAFIRRFFIGATVCIAGFGAILLGIERMPDADRAAPRDETQEAPAASPAPPEIASAIDAKPADRAPAGDSDLGHPANAGLKVNDAGLAIIKESEGLRLDAYEAGGRWYIGYGHSGATPGQTISEAQADGLLREDVRGAEDGVRRLVTVAVNRNEFSAMVSLCYNLGVGGFERSRVLARINDGDREGAADAFLTHNRAGGQVVEHLTERREKERALFLTPA